MMQHEGKGKDDAEHTSDLDRDVGALVSNAYHLYPDVLSAAGCDWSSGGSFTLFASAD
ncbi:MAG: hypothetical protein AB7P21_19105 [Lautropia sp.]